ncbi:opioid growth factor receptor [Denticeps clupeoides]|uniref:Opioid growth factor receptor (OGFr) conserved domain-containing protein n=1 Tax=Denticeps clupeoides TaxID=299321 RepID=A0AAY4E0R0_9TELE|nr:opioid growth factor receptor-like protein 1 [Denticeps clupeoides]
MEDDLVCEYDSTWDTESDGEEPGDNAGRRCGQDKTKKARQGFWSNSSSRNVRAAKDMQNYRHGYPNIIEEECPEERMTNLKFYLNEIPSSPDDVSIEMFHKEWKTDYKRLERVHSYIQWLFPLREPGVNYMATELTKKEIQAFKDNEEAKRKLVESYELMLGFYGIQLLDRESGEVRRSDNWRERFANLERNMHNNLRITRILKSMGELGFEHFQAPLVRFFLEETLVKKNLNSVKRSVLDYFVFAVRDKRERRKLLHYAYQHYEPKDKFVWCPRKIQKRFKKSEKRLESEAGSVDGGSSDESRSRVKAKDKNAGNSQKESSEAPQQMEDDAAMNLDAGKVVEASSLDPESTPEGSSVDPLTNGADNSSENGEMDLSVCNDSSPAKDEEGEDDDDLKECDQEKEAEVRLKSNHELAPSKLSVEKAQKKKRGGQPGTCSNGLSAECPLSPGKGKTPSLPGGGNASKVPLKLDESSPVRRAQRNAVDSPKHVLRSRSSDERAEKHPRTDFSGSVDHDEATEKLQSATSRGMSADKELHTNGSEFRSNEEPMDTESTED